VLGLDEEDLGVVGTAVRAPIVICRWEILADVGAVDSDIKAKFPSLVWRSERGCSDRSTPLFAVYQRHGITTE
jgi:hypothetical protein